MRAKIIRRWDLGLWALLFLGMVVYNTRLIQALDLGWHLASGRYMVDHRAIPHTDVFSFTCFGRPWVNSYWLQDILLFVFYRVAGVTGLIVLKAVFVGVIVWSVARGFLRRYGFLAQAIAAVWIFLGAAPRGYGWSEQASLWTLFFLVVLFLLLEKNNYDLSAMPPLFLFLFFVLWANIHRGFFLGELALGGCVFSDFMTGEARRWLSLQRLALCFIATLITPWGLHLYAMMAVDFHLSPQYIAGWARPPWSHLELFWLTWILFFVAWILRLRRASASASWAPLGISIYLAWNSFRYVSQVPYFMVWAVPFIMGETIARVHNLTSKKIVAMARPALLVTGLFFFLSHRPASGFNGSIFPIEACNFIETQNLSGHFLQDYSFGGYWLWRFGLTKPVFIDGRYPAVQGYAALDAQLQDAMHGSPAAWETFLAHYGVVGALVRYPKNSPLPLPFAAYFPRRVWALVYWDDLDLIFLKRVSTNQSAIARYEYANVQPDVSPALIADHWAHLSEHEKSVWRAELLRNRRAHPESLRTAYLLQLLGVSPP